MNRRLVRWDTPFADAQFPSVVTFVNAGELPSSFTLEAVVSPKGLDEYPKYRVQFGDVIAFAAMEEMHFPGADFENVDVEGQGKFCSYKFLNSPWLESYTQGEYFLFNTDGGDSESLTHYVIFGGDDILQVVTRNEPEISEMREPFTVNMKLEF